MPEVSGSRNVCADWNISSGNIMKGKRDVPMRIAYGYASFDEQYDKNMEETRNRADVKMYEKKRAIKAEERKWKKMREFPLFLL